MIVDDYVKRGNELYSNLQFKALNTKNLNAHIHVLPSVVQNLRGEQQRYPDRTLWPPLMYTLSYSLAGTTKYD